MIKTSSGAPGALILDHSDATVAFIDRDWIPAPADSHVPAIVFTEDGKALWDEAELTTIGDGLERQASALVAGVAMEAASVASGLERVEVQGEGALAGEIRRRLGPAGTSARADRASSLPMAVVDATGDPRMLVSATERLADGGTLVMAGEPLGRETEINLYKHVHVRGLRIVGIKRPGGTSPRSVEAYLPAPRAVRPQEPLPHAAWYRLER